MELDTEALAFLQSKVHTERAVFVDFLSSGRVPTYDEYREVSGVIRGLNIVDSILTDLANKLRDPDDE